MATNKTPKNANQLAKTKALDVKPSEKGKLDPVTKYEQEFTAKTMTNQVQTAKIYDCRKIKTLSTASLYIASISASELQYALIRSRIFFLIKSKKWLKDVSFGEWAEKTHGIKRGQADNLARVGKLVTDDGAHSIFFNADKSVYDYNETQLLVLSNHFSGDIMKITNALATGKFPPVKLEKGKVKRVTKDELKKLLETAYPKKGKEVKEEKPANGKGNPANGEGNPANGEGNPANGEGNPANGEGNPANGEGNPANGKRVITLSIDEEHASALEVALRFYIEKFPTSTGSRFSELLTELVQELNK